MRRIIFVAFAGLAAPLLAGCGSGTDVAKLPSDYSVVASLRALPATSSDAGHPLQIDSADVSKATQLAHSARPKTADQRGQWSADLGKNPVFVPFSDLLGIYYVNTDDVRDVLGFDASDVASFAAIDSPPQSIAVARLAGGAHLKQGVTKTGSAPVGDIDAPAESSTGPGPFPFVLGVGEKDGQVGLAQRTSLLSAWKKGGRSLASNAELHDVAAALDDHHVYAATLSDGGGKVPRELTPEASKQASDRMPAYAAVGIGQAVEHGEEVEYVAYRVGDTGKARAAIEQVWKHGMSLVNQQPISEVAGAVKVSTSGHVVVVELHPKAPAVAMRMLQQVDLPFTALP